MANPVAYIRTLYAETMAEMKKCTWPTRNELKQATGAVLSSLVILAVMVLIFDWVFQIAVRLLTGMN